MSTVNSSNSADISIIIVNYNVKEYLANLLHSIGKARGNLKLEVFIVDNNSTDGSIPFLKERFPEPEYILNKENVGFGRANNQAIAKASGKYTLLVNPDVLVSEDTLSVMFRFMEKNPDVCAGGCKILNPDGTFAPESRRSTPTPLTALYKVLGLSNLFPKSKRFGRYYMGWLDENEANEIEVLSGSFMFFRTDILKKLNGFDDRFFMYGEDIDLCFRARQMGHKIMYVPETSIIHYKGESTKKDNIGYVITFNKALYQFFLKHYNYGYSFLFRVIIIAGIFLKAFTSYFATVFQKTLRPLIDVVTINLVIIVLFLIRFQINPLEFKSAYNLNFFLVNVLLTTFFLLFAKYYSLYGKNINRISSLLKSIFFTFLAIVSITFFLRDFAFSRLILVLGAFTLSILLSFYRLAFISTGKDGSGSGERLASLKVLIVGIDSKTAEIIQKIRSKVEWNYQIMGIVSVSSSKEADYVENVPVVGHISQIAELISAHKANQVIFLLNTISHIDVLKTLTAIRDQNVVCKVVPGSMDYIIGKSNVEYFDDIPVLDFELPAQTAWNRFIKRSFDFWTSGALLVALFPAYAFLYIIQRGKHAICETVQIYVDASTTFSLELFKPLKKHRFLNFYRFLAYIFSGDCSFVGAPVIRSRQGRFIYYKPGLTGLRQVYEDRLFRTSEKERYEMHYLQTYTIWKDFEILLRAIFTDNKSFLDYLQE